MDISIAIFIILQVILLPFMALHDWVHLPPLTDIYALEKNSSKIGRAINSTVFALLIIIPLALTYFYQPNYSFWIKLTIFNFYFFLTLGTIFSWWIPYFFTSAKHHHEQFMAYKNTHHFLPPRGNNITPNTFHVILHLQIWTCLAFAIYLLFFYNN